MERAGESTQQKQVEGSSEYGPIASAACGVADVRNLIVTGLTQVQQEVQQLLGRDETRPLENRPRARFVNPEDRAASRICMAAHVMEYEVQPHR
eukprot:2574382-Amphidinium_carterae.1